MKRLDLSESTKRPWSPARITRVRTAEPGKANDGPHDAAPEETGADVGKAIDNGLLTDDGGPATPTGPAGPDAESDTGTGGGDGTLPTGAAGAPDAPVPAAGAPAVPPGHVCPTCGQRRRAAAPKATAGGGSRLGSGRLHQMVLDHLREHPDEDWTATGIANVIGRSSGAIANALDTMLGRGEAVQTCDKPRRYRATTGVAAV